MKRETFIERIRLSRVERIKKFLKDDLDIVIKEIKPHRPILGALYGTNLLLNINCNSHYDSYLVDSLQDEEIEKMIKILLHYEKIRFAGSVSAIPNLLRKLKRRNYKNFKEIVDWVIEFNDKSNPWIPTGYFKDQNLTTSEYLNKTLY